MSDRYLDFINSSFGQTVASALGLPTPPRLQRAKSAWAERPLEGKAVLVGGDAQATLSAPLLAALSATGAQLRIAADHAGLAPVKAAAAAQNLALTGEPLPGTGEPASHALVFDASGLQTPEQMRQVYEFFQPRVRALPRNARIVVLTRAADACKEAGAKAMSMALRGFVRSLGKEVGKNGTTCNLLEVAAGGDAHLEAPLRFFLTSHSAYVDAQVLRLTKGGDAVSLADSLNGRVAVITGAARGIGAAIAEVFAREGAQVIGVDHPSAEGALGETMSRLGGQGLALDVTAPDAAQRIAEAAQGLGGLDVIVHNAGVTRDKMLRNMTPQQWDMVLNINLAAILNINAGLLEDKAFNKGARAVCISSIGGISGNAGQTNYAATKSALIGYVAAMAETFAKNGGAINAVAPGFIETQMTAAMPMGPREVGRRINSLSQGGLPQDIAEAVAFFASGAASGVNGQTLRVCGQNWFGA
ncbi:3-oxoacyl-ACP reductase [Sinimarinibacterium sp. NLF-5-8]|uniref:3-oxoacyl-ACP reductase n=1 Tax=Sinimarinibacterium sp. NLF-5-8 TaxID=2698684 RepID=UPI00137BBDBD|nr:3-oxoacyl-ACP reductase [Sinimarinibacterium sp. NLF-5-8]QHS10141.1 3-oxoacyl-ACP reductase [Sinimarinibacterium sp. NLF-5-8]